ncbi:MAG: SMI1/KNR4 family protein [Candidatus Sumerlaeaceae bacterium]|nr:SMI1/KNR4 family protein [Candidatus Sumerlaeaceae bacterium]
MALPDYAPVIEQIAAQTGVTFRAASPDDLAKLEALGVPESVLTFFREFEPSDCVQGQVRLWPIMQVMEENEKLIPGVYASKHGYIVFATTDCGDTYCFDLTDPGVPEPPIVLLSHEVISEDTSVEDLARLAKPVAKDLHDFLQRFVRGEVDEECID